MTGSAEVSTEILERICAENLAVYRESPARLQEDVSQESQVAHDYRGRLVYELLQNSDDALAGVATTDDKVLFRLTDDELWVANSGRPFSDADVRGLCGLGASSKSAADGPKRASIGHKGLGFKSVLQITDRPEAYSETTSFRLGRDTANARVGVLWTDLERGAVRGVPAMRFPSEIDSSHPVWMQLQAQGFRTAFRFPLRAELDGDEKAALAHQLLTLPMTSVLFLKHLEEIVIEVDTSTRKGDREWILERKRVTASGLKRCEGLTTSGLYRVDLVNRDGEGDNYWVAHDDDVRVGDHREGLNGPAWEGVDLTEVSVAVRAGGDPRINDDDRRFHVFLPTQEHSGCSLLVNGAFTTDLSRQRVKVEDGPTNYNAYLVRHAATTFVGMLLPHLLEHEGPRTVLQALERNTSELGGAAGLFTQSLIEALALAPLLPAGDKKIALAQSVLPSALLAESGRDFAELLTLQASVDGRRFPDPEFCEGALAAVCTDYGAQALSPLQTLQTLAEKVDPDKAHLRTGPDPRYQVDPILDLCTLLWERCNANDRQELESSARYHAVFPVGASADGRVKRIALGEQSAFYPPKLASEDLPLKRLQFLAHAVCWGSLGRTEQRTALEQRMKAWDALFEVKEFSFAEVMRAAVLPGLTRTGSVDTDLRDANRTFEVLATICRLAGTTTKPDQPLPLGRLGSDRAFFNLSRLEVPCRPDLDGTVKWVPAHHVYFGRDWVAQYSVEEITDAMAAAGAPIEVDFLAGPEYFAPFSEAIGVDTDDEIVPEELETSDDEIDLEDDTDEVLETTVGDRWRNFFAWLGVSRGLRLVHFQDVDDSGTGWTSTKDLELPGGRAFSTMERAWNDYKAALVAGLPSDPRWPTTDHYLYQVHNLDLLDEISEVARLKDNDVAARLLAHLVLNWRSYARHTQAQLALVGTGKYPSQRSKPPRAMTEELVTAGPDFWLYRLRSHAICPTSHGPRRPGQTWRPSQELHRRLGRSGREADAFLPVLKDPGEVPQHYLRSCLDELQVRGELTPAAFTIDDARGLCGRIEELYSTGVSEQQMRSELRPIYRQMFELLVGTTSEDTPLATAHLAARTADGISFMPAREIVFASVSGSRERSGVQDKIPLFVLEAESGARRPLRDLFGMPDLESALEWSVLPGESSLAPDELDVFRRGLGGLARPLRARLSADRADRSTEDAKALREFVQRLEPVESLKLTCAFRGEHLGEIPQRTYHVRRDEQTGFQGFVVWSGQPWPPVPEDSQSLAMALAEALEVNTVETFLSFINASPSQREQLLELAGAADWLDDADDALGESTSREASGNSAGADSGSKSQHTTDGESTEPEPTAGVWNTPTTTPGAVRIPLHKFEDLLVDGEMFRIEGTGAQPGTTTDGAATDDLSSADGNLTSAGSGGPPRAAAGTNLQELDQLGMRITFAFERRRLETKTAAILPSTCGAHDADVLIVDVSTPAMIAAAIDQSSVVKEVFAELVSHGLNEMYPGFDILTIVDGAIDRMIELKSSGVDAQVQAMSWNEWKTSRGALRGHFWLYLVGNLRADLQNALPYVRAVQDPFGTLASATFEDTIRKRSVQLRVREFVAADELTLTLRRDMPSN